MSRSLAILACCVLVVLSLTLYFSAGLQQAYLAEDDFQWIAGGYIFSGPLSLWPPRGDAFYRPVVGLWFTGLVETCGPVASCYHVGSLAIHLISVVLVMTIGLSLSRDLRIAFLGALLFALQPAYAQAVIWVSASTELLSALFYLTSLQALTLSWRREDRARLGWEAVTLLSFVLSLLCHEAAVTLPVVAWVMWRQFGPPVMRRPFLAGGLALCMGCFALLTVAANHRSDLIVNNHYRLGPHMLQHGLDYAVGFYVGPADLTAYVAVVIGLAVLMLWKPMTRFGAIWLIVALLPFLGFTWGNVGRYSYLASIGFAFGVAAAIVALCDWVAARLSKPVAGHLLYAALTLFVGIRFGKIDHAAIRSQVQWTEQWRSHAAELTREARLLPDGVVALDDRKYSINRIYIEPLLQFVRQDYRLRVVYHGPPETGANP